jgi:histidine ammonia-lyase
MKATITTKGFTLDDIPTLLQSELELGQDVKDIVTENRAYLENKLKEPNAIFYGINTGFGDLCDTQIPHDQLSDLQHNLVRSHACGMGDAIDEKLVRIMLLLKIQSLSYGSSGIRLVLLEKLVEFFNNHIHPVVYELGSLGASGDLAPLAHLSLTILGEGKVWKNGLHTDSLEVLKEHGIETLSLEAKEGLALLNGTQFMGAMASNAVLEGEKVLLWADTITAISAEAFGAKSVPYSPLIAGVRKHPGHAICSSRIRGLFEGSEQRKHLPDVVQDPYSFRCVPQVHGASIDGFTYVKEVVNREIASVTDNPLIMHKQDEILSGGNFHGQPLALPLDYTAMLLAEIGSISERRIFKLLSGKRGLPPFLANNPGVESGFMIPQYTAAAIVNVNKALCMPNSVDSVDSSNGQEDHVSMGANAGVKLQKVLGNVQKILGIELMSAINAWKFRTPGKTSVKLEKIISSYKQKVQLVEKDIYFKPVMDDSVEFVLNYDIKQIFI